MKGMAHAVLGTPTGDTYAATEKTEPAVGLLLPSARNRCGLSVDCRSALWALFLDRQFAPTSYTIFLRFPLGEAQKGTSRGVTHQ